MSSPQHADAQAVPISAIQRPSVPEAAYDAFFKVVGRLETLLVEETAAVKRGASLDLPELTRRKRQGLLELNRLMQAFKGTIPSQDIINRLAAFRITLNANETALQLHLQAAQEVTATIVRVMRELESDGTYTRAYRAIGARSA